MLENKKKRELSGNQYIVFNNEKKNKDGFPIQNKTLNL